MSTIDDLIAAEPHEERHPLYGVVAYLLDRSPTPGIGLFDRCKQLAEEAITRLVEEKLADASAWEVD